MARHGPDTGEGFALRIGWKNPFHLIDTVSSLMGRPVPGVYG
jgi:hypothetical protein